MDFNEREEKRKIVEKIISLLSLVIVILAIGTIDYSRLEGWSFVDSLYFSATTLTTIGYGDLHPTKDITKLFTVFFALTGVATMLYTLSVLGTHYVHYLDKHKPLIEHNVRRAIKRVYPPLGRKESDWFVLKEHKKKE